MVVERDGWRRPVWAFIAQQQAAADELAASGLIRKTRATGLAGLQAAYPVHLASVRDRVLDHVDRDALPYFRQALAAIARALD